MRRFLAVLVFSTAQLFVMPCHAQDASPEKVISFADYLYAQGDYYRAITEYERFLFHYPSHALAENARYQIGMSYFKGDKFSQAIQKFLELSEKYPRSEVGKKSLIMLSEAYSRKRDYSPAIGALNRFIERYPDDPEMDGARIKKGWLYLEQRDWARASEQFRSLPEESAFHERAASLAEEAKKYPDIPRKSPGLAAGLSAIVPGAGQLYVKRPSDAGVSFLLNGVFIWGTVEAFKNHNDVTGGILLFFESGWYLGNIYNAMGSAYKYNNRAEREFLDKLQRQYGISYYRDEQGSKLLAVTRRF